MHPGIHENKTRRRPSGRPQYVKPGGQDVVVVGVVVAGAAVLATAVETVVDSQTHLEQY